LARDRFVIGDPESVVDDIRTLESRLGATTAIFRVQWPGLEQDAALRTIRLLGERVLPRV
jgi:alkanesulfonate monooxygenase SsuD/methylene tetrahydromethanopterin reductase-like flavin-dependent oxidoreductase (luciferase family)